MKKSDTKADSNPTKPSSLQHPPFNKIVKNTLDLQNNEERLKEVESIVKSMSPTLIHSIQAASHYGLCYKHINSFQYVNTTEPLDPSKALKMHISFQLCNSNHEKCTIYNSLKYIQTDNVNDFILGQGVVFLDPNTKKIGSSLQESKIQDVIVYKNESTESNSIDCKLLNKDIHVEPFQKQDIQEYDNIYIPIYKQEYCCICQYRIGIIKNIKHIQSHSYIEILPLSCCDQYDSTIYGRSDLFSTQPKTEFYGTIHTITTVQSNTRVFVDQVTLSNPRFILGTFELNTPSSPYEYKYNMYPSQAILYPCPFYYHDSYDLSVQSICHSCRHAILSNDQLYSCCSCKTTYCSQCYTHFIEDKQCKVCTFTCDCSICKYIFIQSEQEPQLQLIKPTTTFSKDPQNPSIHFYLKTNQQRNNIGTIKSYSSTTKEPADISAVISLFTSIQIYFDRVYMPATGNSLLSQYIYLYMSFIASHLILKSWNLEPIFTFLSSSSNTQEKKKEDTKKPHKWYPLESSLKPFYQSPSMFVHHTNQELFSKRNNQIVKTMTHSTPKRLRFERSNIHSWGVFTDDPIKEKEFICEYTGELIRSSLQDVRQAIYLKNEHNSDYMFKVDDQFIIDATSMGSIARFINHSCDPNCYSAILKEGKNKKIAIFAKRAILPGEELTYDYKFPFEEEKIKCNCGSSKCRGSLN